MKVLQHLCLAFAFAALTVAAQAQQPPAPAQANRVLTILTVKPGVDMAQVMKVMPEEVRATVRLYLDGKIDQWYSQAEGRGVVFILNCATTAEARSMMEGLPLGQGHLADYQFTPLSPLTPLRMLVGPPPAPAAAP